MGTLLLVRHSGVEVENVRSTKVLAIQLGT
jgi:hypothetical protein